MIIIIAGDVGRRQAPTISSRFTYVFRHRNVSSRRLELIIIIILETIPHETWLYLLRGGKGGVKPIICFEALPSGLHFSCPVLRSPQFSHWILGLALPSGLHPGSRDPNASGADLKCKWRGAWEAAAPHKILRTHIRSRHRNVASRHLKLIITTIHESLRHET